MKTILSLFFLGILSLISPMKNAYSSELRLQKVKILGPQKHRVIYQSADVKFIKKSNLVRGKIVAQWGTEVFEVATAFYACNSKKYCKFQDYERVAMYESCVVKKAAVSCTNKLVNDNDSGSNEIGIGSRPDGISDDSEVIDNDQHEFPARIEDEFSDLF